MRLVWALGVTAALLVLSAIGNILQYARPVGKVEERNDTVTRVEYITKTDTLPIEKTETVVKYVKVSDILQNETDSGDVSVVDSLPVVQKTYTDDSTYTAYISGIKYQDLPRLDSISVREKTIERIITKTVEKKSRWSVGISAGYGLGLKSGKAEPYIGIGVNYAIWMF